MTEQLEIIPIGEVAPFIAFTDRHVDALTSALNEGIADGLTVEQLALVLADDGAPPVSVPRESLAALLTLAGLEHPLASPAPESCTWVVVSLAGQIATFAVDHELVEIDGRQCLKLSERARPRLSGSQEVTDVDYN